MPSAGLLLGGSALRRWQAGDWRQGLAGRSLPPLPPLACYQALKHTRLMTNLFCRLGPLVSLWMSLSVALAQPLQAQEDAGREHLVESIKTYAAGVLGVNRSEITVIATDRRLRVPVCDGGFEHSFPFADAVTVKAQCADPQWQAFIRIKHEPKPPPMQIENQTQEIPAVVFVVKERVHRGQRLSAAKLQQTAADKTTPRDALASDQGLELLEATRMLRVGEVLRASMVKSAPAIKKGERVKLRLEKGGLAIEIEVEALVNGQIGDRIRFRNIESGQELQAEVVEIGQAAIRD
jgi:flagella basal body P-ring formation protein FlgA